MSKKEPITPSNPKRGWIFDQLMLVGQIEAGMCHNDEEVCNLYADMDNFGDDPDEIQKIANKLNTNVELIKDDYLDRVDALNEVFDAVEGSDRHYYCQVKHRATRFVLAAENYHARGCSPEAEARLVAAGKALATTCSLAFGFEPMQCLRCLDEALKGKK